MFWEAAVFFVATEETSQQDQTTRIVRSGALALNIGVSLFREAPPTWWFSCWLPSKKQQQALSKNKENTSHPFTETRFSFFGVPSKPTAALQEVARRFRFRERGTARSSVREAPCGRTGDGRIRGASRGMGSLKSTDMEGTCGCFVFLFPPV